MEKHFNLTNLEFERQFETYKLDPSIFTHEAHLRLAWINISKYGVVEAEKNIQRQLKGFVEVVGETDKYHKTLTIVAVRAVHHFMQQSLTDNFKDFLKENSQLKNDFKALINSHYSIDIFNSSIAKSQYIAPDLIPFS